MSSFVFFLSALALYALSMYHMRETEAYKAPGFMRLLLTGAMPLCAGAILGLYSLGIVAGKISFAQFAMDPFVAFGTMLLIAAAGFYTATAIALRRYRKP